MKRVYVKVNSSFDETGYMRPTSLVWGNRSLPIEEIKEFRPAQSGGDCYTVVIRGKEKHLFFEKTDPLFSSTLGRWFVECSG